MRNRESVKNHGLSSPPFRMTNLQKGMHMENVLTVTEVARRLGITRHRVYQLIADERIKTTRFGKAHHIVSPEELDRFISEDRDRRFAR